MRRQAGRRKCACLRFTIEGSNDVGMYILKATDKSGCKVDDYVSEDDADARAAEWIADGCTNVRLVTDLNQLILRYPEPVPQLTNSFTHDTSNKTARYLVRGYFTGDGQHWIAVWDNAAQCYCGTERQGVSLFRTADEAIAYLRDCGRIAQEGS